MKRSLASLAQRLAGVEWFSSFAPDALESLAAGGGRRLLREGETLWRRGERPDAVAAILRGQLRVERVTEAGERVLFRVLGQDRLVGLSTLAGAVHSADVVAGEETEVFAVRGDALRGAIVQAPQLALQALARMGELVARLSDEVEALRFSSLEQRIAQVLVERGRGLREVRITHEELAAQAGATRANVSRALARLEKVGRIVRHRGRIAICSLQEVR